MPARRVVIVLFDGVQALDVAGPVDALSSANRVEGAGRGYALTTASRGRAPVRTSAGLTLAADTALEELHGPIDTLLVPGGRGLRANAVDEALVAALGPLARRARRVCAVCTGAFALAQGGLLDGRRATTHWSRCDELARAHPAVAVEPDRIYVRDGDCWTSGGVTAGIDLTLALIEDDLGAATARTVARRLVVFLQRPGGQSQFSERLAMPPVDLRSPVREAVDAIVAAPAEPHTLPQLAAAAAVSERHLTRLFAAQVGTSPGRFVERVRLEAARAELEGSDLKLDAIAARCGFASAETLRRAFVRVLGISPGEYRARFRRT